MPELGGAEVLLVLLLLIPMLALPIFLGYATGRLFRKAGRQLWEGFVPFYNWFVWAEIVGRPAWWAVLLFIPFVNVVAQVFLAIDMARSFGKDEVFGVVMLWLLAFIGVPIIAFDDSVYKGPSVVNPNSLVQQ